MSATPAIVLAGGASARLGGVDKTRLVLGGVPLLDRVLAVLTGLPSPSRLFPADG